MVIVSGCASEGLGGGDYSRGQVRGEQTVRMGVVEQVRQVKIDGTRSAACGSNRAIDGISSTGCGCQ